VLMAFLLISSIATLSWTSIRPRRAIRLELLAVLGLVGAALLTEPWLTLVGICAIYLLLIPYGIWSYSRVKRQRASRASGESEPLPPA
jgi:CDP-diacylglycerol---serine O-phosphatidyltransferase